MGLWVNGFRKNLLTILNKSSTFPIMYEYPIKIEKTEIKEGKRKLHPDWKCKTYQDGTLIIYKTMDKKLIEIVDKITWDILENNPNLDQLTQEWGIPVIEVKYYAGFGYTSVEFLGFDIWSSENDEREWIEEDKEYEDMEKFLMKQIQNIVDRGVLNVKL